MKIIISPAKKMKVNTDAPGSLTEPVFLDRAQVLLGWLKSLSYAEAKSVWECSDRIAEESYAGIRNISLHRGRTPAVLAYDGIQYTYMAPAVFEESHLAYIQEHLRILSGFYGALKPLDGVVPYRLEMKAKVRVSGCSNLYDFWGRRLYEEVRDESGIIINLASKEYARCIEKYLQEDDRFITCIFGEMDKGRVMQKGVYAKIARGEMVRFMAENKVTDPEELKRFQTEGYSYKEGLSSEDTYVFLKNDRA
ncbi:MAG: peroxide stress protein YaaA [Eubacterium sp.]|nr:peroxide stress protein YaaA [Eubacterium sp.]